MKRIASGQSLRIGVAMLNDRSPSDVRSAVQRFTRTLARPPVRIAIIALHLALCTVLLLAAGRPYFTLVHWFYFPVLLAAHWFFTPGGLLAGIAAGVLASPHVIASAVPVDQSGHAWMYRSLFFVGIGVSAGYLRGVFVQRSNRLEATVKHLTRTYARTLRALVRLLEHHDEETGSHCERVARNARAVGRAMGFTELQLETLYWAGYMHDLGKLASPAKMLLKDGPLTPEEYEIMKQHAAIGADTIMTITPAFLDIADAVRSHHERWDGRGYPRGLADEEIPIFGRILAVVDAFEAMTSDRPYRKAMDPQQAIAILAKEAGLQFDADVVATFFELLEAGAIHIEALDGKHTGIDLPVEFSPEFLTGKSIFQTQS